MKEIKVQSLNPNSVRIEPLKATRDWMDASSGRHAYMCFPMTLANGLGWSISLNKDVRFIWDGTESSLPDHVKILEGEDVAYSGRGHASLSFRTEIVINTDENTSILTMPVPNQFIRGIQTITTIMSTSFYRGQFPIAVKVTEPDKEIFIPAGTPIAAILPISLSALQTDYEMIISQGNLPSEYWEELRKYGEAAEEKNSKGEWSKMYRDAVDYNGNSVGSHETKAIRLKTTVCPITGMSVEGQ